MCLGVFVCVKKKTHRGEGTGAHTPVGTGALIVRVLLYVFLLQERNYIMIEVYTVACGVMVYRL